MTQKTKNVALEKLLEQTSLKPCNFWAGEALEARRRESLNITSTRKWHSDIFQISAEKNFPDLIKEISCTYWMNVEVLPHDFCKLQPLKLYKIVQEPFCQARKLFSAEIWKMAECHFWADVMLRQSHLRASRASPAQKSQGLRVVCSKNFSRATFFVFWVTQLEDKYVNNLPVKQIWRKSAVWGSCTPIDCLWYGYFLEHMLV